MSNVMTNSYTLGVKTLYQQLHDAGGWDNLPKMEKQKWISAFIAATDAYMAEVFKGYSKEMDNKGGSYGELG